jgi:hypothetical protein
MRTPVETGGRHQSECPADIVGIRTPAGVFFCGQRRALPTRAKPVLNQRTAAEINAAPTQNTTIASDGTRQRSSRRKPTNIAAIGRG